MLESLFNTIAGGKTETLIKRDSGNCASLPINSMIWHWLSPILILYKCPQNIVVKVVCRVVKIVTSSVTNLLKMASCLRISLNLQKGHYFKLI